MPNKNNIISNNALESIRNVKKIAADAGLIENYLNSLMAILEELKNYSPNDASIINLSSELEVGRKSIEEIKWHARELSALLSRSDESSR
jgi:hypothetical protein